MEACGHALICGTVPEINWRVCRMTWDFVQDILCTDRDLNPKPLQYEAGLLQICSDVWMLRCVILDHVFIGQDFSGRVVGPTVILLSIVGQRLYCICLTGMSGYPFIQIPRQKRR